MADTQHTQTRPKFTAPKKSSNQKPLDLIQTVKTSAMYSWQNLLPACGIEIPAKGKHGACPVCGGTNRFHFIDDHHHGNWHCRQCDAPNYGDGLDLVARTNGISILEAAKVIANVQALPLPELKPAKEIIYPTQPIAERVAALMAQTVTGQSPYLTAKGLHCPNQRLLPDNSAVLALTTLDKKVTGAQIIKPNGEKKLLSGSQKKGAFIAVSAPEAHSDTVIITEGYANHTALWQCIRSRTALKEPCSTALVRDDLKSMGVNVKNFSRWLTKLEQDGLITRHGQELSIVNQNNED